MKKLGKQRTRIVKRKAEKVFRSNPEGFTEEFKKNKEKLKDMNLPLTKVDRNIIAGYLTTLVEKHKRAL